MRLKNYLLILIGCFMMLSCKNESRKTAILSKTSVKNTQDLRILTYRINPKKQSLKFYWKNKKDSIIQTFNNLKTEVESNKEALVFAMNGGMYKKDFSPQGLYVEKGKILSKLDTIDKGFGNFYLQPNGVFLITENGMPIITKTQDFKIYNAIDYATQSGPMLVIDGTLHPKFNKGSSNLNIRNGVGVLPNGDLLFAMSKEKINFYDFALFFKDKGCENALYLDGFVSKTYLPSKQWEQLEGEFGVIIAETKSLNN
ncbi:phosphodiester glycosidase family protein [Lacinutrix mariniflava]|uniref:phosphodiester glycosidase family protein n=1 Tax=Lacinutrix mariniflava TaxID=342955 RepID=UPI000AEB6ABE|nr:phosphodiester glycosidase family protein [Lacinutrix mariniflava]